MYVVMLGINIVYTCNALRYNPAFIAMGRVSDCHAKDPGSNLGRDKRCLAFNTIIFPSHMQCFRIYAGYCRNTVEGL